MWRFQRDLELVLLYDPANVILETYVKTHSYQILRYMFKFLTIYSEKAKIWD